MGIFKQLLRGNDDPHSDRPEENEGSWPAGVALRKTSSGQASWTISVPADGKSHTEEINKAVEQAIKAWKVLESTFKKAGAA